MQMPQLSRLGSEEEACLENCLQAAAACDFCADACIGEDGMDACARTCRDTADAVRLQAALVARGSGHAARYAKITADVAEQCAAECRKHEADHCRQCADVLDACVKSCRAMAA